MPPKRKIASNKVTGATFAFSGLVASVLAIGLLTAGCQKPKALPDKKPGWTATTLNAYWFISPEEKNPEETSTGESFFDSTFKKLGPKPTWTDKHAAQEIGDRPQSEDELQEKAQNLASLLQKSFEGHTPGIIALQEIGGAEELQLLADTLLPSTGITWKTLFKQGKDTFTGQNVGALINEGTGWKLKGKPSRIGELDKVLPKHLSFLLGKDGEAIQVIVVHLKMPTDNGAKILRKQQFEALKEYAQKLLVSPRARLLILGDFGNLEPPGSQSGNMLILTRHGMLDTSEFLEGDPSTHQKIGGTLDRILISPALDPPKAFKIQASDIWLTPHNLPPHLGSSHYPVTLLMEEPKK